MVAKEMAEVSRRLSRDFEVKSAELDASARGVREALEAERAEIDKVAAERLDAAAAHIDHRLNAVESAAGAAARDLETTFAALDARLRQVESGIDRLGAPGERAPFAADFENRLQNLSRELAGLVAAARAEIADEVAAADSEQSHAVARLSAQVSRLADAVDSHLREAEAGARTAAEAERDAAAELTRLDARLTYAEETSAAALSAMSRRVDALDARSGAMADHLGEQIRESESRTHAFVDDVMASRARIQDVSSPVQRALDTLRARLAALEIAREAVLAPDGVANDDGEDADSRATEFDDHPDDVSDDEPDLPLDPLREPRRREGGLPTPSRRFPQEDAFTFVTGGALDDIERDDQLLYPIEGMAVRRRRSQFDVLRAALDGLRSAALGQGTALERAGEGGDLVQPGFGPVPSPVPAAGRAKRARTLLFAVGGLAVLAVGAAGVTVLHDLSSADGPRDGGADRLDNLVSSSADAADTPSALEAPLNPPTVAAPAPAPAPLTTPADILRAQKALATLGYYKGDPDGRMGPMTQKAVAWYQKDLLMAPTGALTTTLLEKMEAEASSF
jgi:hypothetical protein